MTHDTYARPKLTASSETLPPPIRVLNAVGRATRAKRLGRFRLEETALKDTAIQATGLSDFGDAHFEEGLRALLASVEQASLHFLGQVLLRQTIVGSLSNRLLLVETQKR